MNRPSPARLPRALVAALVLAACPLAQERDERSSEAADAARIRRAMDDCAASLLAGPALHSASIGVFEGGQVQLAHYGTLEPGGSVPPTDTTLYEIASITKIFTGILVGHALVESKLTLDQEVAPLLPGTYDNLQFEGQPIRLRHLVTHTSGLPFSLHAEELLARETWGPDLPARLNALAPEYDEERFWDDLHAVVLVEPPGTTSRYSNAGTELAAAVLERVYETDFRDLVQRKILGPQGMVDTTWVLDPGQAKRLAPGHGEGALRVPSTIVQGWGAADGLKSTPADLMRLVRLQLEDPTPAIVRSREPLFEDARTTLACFWHIEQRGDDGPHYVYHGGAFGAQNYLLLVPDRGLGISIVTNKSDRETNERLYRGLSQLLDDLRGAETRR